MLEIEEFAWRACELGEQPWDRETPFCFEPCSGCLVVATVELNKLDPLAVDPVELAWWHQLIAVLAGEAVDV